MVVFTCNNCGESLQKPKVEKHYLFACRSAKNLTCVDCFKDFRNEEYQVHTKCVTEEERYSAKGTFPNSIQKKGVVKQDNWIELITAAIDSAGIRKGRQSVIVDAVLGSSNVPRKKPKFVNFIKSTCGPRTSESDINIVWDVIDKYRIKQQNAAIAESNKISNNKEVVNAAPLSTPISNGASSMTEVEDPKLETKGLTIESIKIALKSAEGSQKKLAKQVLKLENIPLKKKKFIKYVQNEIQDVNLSDVQALWNVVEKPGSKTEDKNEDEEMDCDDDSNTKEMSIELIKTALKAAEISQAIQKKIVKKILKLDNIPLKKKKFIKFIQNEFKGTDINDIVAIWNVIQQHKSGLECEVQTKSETSMEEVKELMEVVTISNDKMGGDTSLNGSLNKKGDISIELIKSALKIAVITDSVQQKLVEKILKLDNIPTTKNKFIKFIQREIKNSDPKNVHAMWEIVEKNVANSKSVQSNNSDLNDSQAIWKIVNKYVDNSGHPQQNGIKSDDSIKIANGNNDDNVRYIDLVKSALQTKSFSKAGEIKIKNFILTQTKLPLKKRRFIAFIEKVINDVESEDIENIWNFIEEYKQANSSKQAQKRKGEDVGNEKTKKLKVEIQFNEKKRKLSENHDNVKRMKGEENAQGVATKTKKVASFSYRDTISEILNKHDSLSLATLEKKVLKKYRKVQGESCKGFPKNFNKQLKKISNVKIDGDVVTILNN